MKCPFCDKENPDSARFCASCGKSLEQMNGSEDDSKNRKDKKHVMPAGKDTEGGKAAKRKKRILAIIIPTAAVVIAAVIAFCCIIFGDNNETADEDAAYSQAIENYTNVEDQISDLILSDEYIDEEAQTKAEMALYLLEELEGSGEIEEGSIEYDEDTQIISYCYADGSYGAIMLEDIPEGIAGTGTDDFVTEYNENGLVDDYDYIPEFDVAGSPYEGEYSVLIMYGLGESEGYEDILDLSEKDEEYWNEGYLNVTLEKECTVEKFRTILAGYDYISIQIHGLIYSGKSTILLEEKADECDVATWADRVLNLVGVVNMNDGSKQYFLTGSFFSFYYNDNEESDNTIVWIGSCDSFHENSLVEGFSDAGAEVVIACTETVNCYYGCYMQDAFMYSLLCGNTVEESLDFAKSLWGDNDSDFAENYGDWEDSDPSEFRIYTDVTWDPGSKTFVTLTEEAAASLETETSEIELYDEILDLFYYGISSQWENYDDFDDEGDEYYDAVSYLWWFYADYDDLSLSDAGYAFIDLDGDGISELLVDVYEEDGGHGSAIRDLYTYQDGEVIHLAYSAERWQYWLCSDYKIGERGSGSASTGGYDYYEVSSGSDELVLIESLNYEYEDNASEPIWYYSDSAYASEYFTSDVTVISDDEAQAIIDSYVELEYDLTPFSEYTPSGEAAEEETEADAAYNALLDFVENEGYLSAITLSDYGYDSFEDLLDNGCEPYYVIDDLNADGISELLICAKESDGFYFTWTFVYSQGEVVLIDEFYGYGQYRYSTAYNAVVVPGETRSSVYYVCISFYQINGTEFNWLFSIIYDGYNEMISSLDGELLWYYCDSSGNSLMDTTYSDSEYSEGIENLAWVPLE